MPIVHSKWQSWCGFSKVLPFSEIAKIGDGRYFKLGGVSWDASMDWLQWMSNLNLHLLALYILYTLKIICEISAIKKKEDNSREINETFSLCINYIIGTRDFRNGVRCIP